MVGKVTVERTERLRRLCKSIVDDPHSIDGDTKAKLQTAALKYAATQYVDTTQALKNLYHDESELGVLLRKAVEIVGEADGDDSNKGGGATDHPVSRLADILVESSRFPDRASALAWLTSHPTGAALVRTHKAKDDSPMNDTVLSIMKSGGIAGTCAAIVAKGSTTILEDELVAAVSKLAHERWPELTEAQAFVKVHDGPEGRVLRQAINVAKTSLAETMLGPGLPVQVVSGPAARNVDTAEEAERARAELMRIGRRQWPRATEAEVFERAFTDPRNATLVAHLYQRPTPTSIYPMPHSWLQGDGSQHAKSDHDSGAYGELLAKAREYQAAHPELSEAQAFEKIYTDRANVELAKRERIESAPR